jgi:pyruvate,water dikinase
MTKKQIVWFDEVDKHDVGLVGGKGANLGEMVQAGFPIPYGFIVTSNAYFEFVKENDLEKHFKHYLAILNFENPKELQQAAKGMQQLILDAKMSSALVEKIIDYYDYLPTKERKILHKHNKNAIIEKLKTTYSPPLVAIRSSATAEDLPNASFAGQQETYLNIKGENHLIRKIQECWASLFTERALYYRYQQGFDHLKVGLAAVVQRMVESDKSGIAFSIDPLTNDKSTVTIEAILGLGEYIVQGKVTPDHYEVDKKTFDITKSEVKYQDSMYVKKGNGNIEIKLDKKHGNVKKLKDTEILHLAHLVKRIEKHYFFPQDIEWAINGEDIFIVQARPITTIKALEDRSQSDANAMASMTSNHLLLKGDPASPGIGFGPVCIIESPKEIDRVKKGDVLVAPQTNPDYVPAMKKASAIITEMGGRTSHASIVSRELGIPAVVGAMDAIKILKHESIISVNGKTGEIFKGNILSTSASRLIAENKNTESSEAKKLKTLTKVYVNMAQPSQAERVSQLNVDGVGLLRAEFMVADIGTHPKEFIKEHREQEFINRLAKDILKFAKSFSPRPITYRATDFKTNEYSHLIGGKKYEPKEENPMLGFRGASRYIVDRAVFSMELQALKKVRELGYKNINLMIPFIRTPKELVQIREILQYHDLLNLPSFKLWIMVEVPATAIMLEEFIEIGIDGVSIGTNDLTMLLLGVDRDNQEIAHIYDERNPAVLYMLEKIVKTSAKHGITCSVCGQAPSDYPEMVEKLVQWGVTSLSLNPDAVDATRKQIYEIEKRLWQKSRK